MLAALEESKADVSYEELECLGLDMNVDRLVTTFRIKRPIGYSGDLCSTGSIEHIAFWVDWDDQCEWTYLDTVSVNVHDIREIPDGGLCYAAVLPVDLTMIRRPCKEPKVARVRAVLSWAIAPRPPTRSSRRSQPRQRRGWELPASLDSPCVST